MKKYKILDCTLRDGGYYNDWDFEDEIIDGYIESMNHLPIDYLELGYRNMPSKSYLGKLAYCPVSVLKRIREKSSKKLTVMLNEKSTTVEDLEILLNPIVGLVDMIRIAVDPKRFGSSVTLAKAIKSKGFEVGFNTMYMSKWKEYDGFLDKLDVLDGVADLFVMVDSYGGITPEEVAATAKNIKPRVNCYVGFHGHNNLQMGLINTLTAIENGVDFVDATILGMGRGAGNLNMELLLTVLSQRGIEVDFNVLGEAVSTIQPLYDKYNWGTNLPYMISGANSLSQKDVMDWVSNRTYSFNSIVRALDNKCNKQADNARYPIWNAPHSSKVLIVGGGDSVREHIQGIREYLTNNADVAIVFATCRYADLLNDLINKKIYCLVGNESKRLNSKITPEQFDGICVLPPYPRTMGTEVPDLAADKTFELSEIAFTKEYLDSCTTTALKVAIELSADEVYVTGYDGYKHSVLSEKEAILTAENRALFDSFKLFTSKDLISFTPSLYKSLVVKSVYQYLQ